MDPRRIALAKQLANNELLSEFITAHAADIHEAWETADTVERREDLWHQHRALSELRGYLDARISELTREG